MFVFWTHIVCVLMYYADVLLYRLYLLHTYFVGCCVCIMNILLRCHTCVCVSVGCVTRLLMDYDVYILVVDVCVCCELP